MSPCCEEFVENASRKGSGWGEAAIRKDHRGRWCAVTSRRVEDRGGGSSSRTGLVPIGFCPFCGAELEGKP